MTLNTPPQATYPKAGLLWGSVVCQWTLEPIPDIGMHIDDDPVHRDLFALHMSVFDSNMNGVRTDNDSNMKGVRTDNECRNQHD